MYVSFPYPLRANAGVAELPPEVGNLRRLEGLQVEGVALKEPLASLYAANPLLLVQVRSCGHLQGNRCSEI